MVPLVDLGGTRDAPLLIFMQFSGKIGQIIGSRPLLQLAHTPLGNPGSATGYYPAFKIQWTFVLIDGQLTNEIFSKKNMMLPQKLKFAQSRLPVLMMLNGVNWGTQEK